MEAAADAAGVVDAIDAVCPLVPILPRPRLPWQRGGKEPGGGTTVGEGGWR